MHQSNRQSQKLSLMPSGCEPGGDILVSNPEFFCSAQSVRRFRNFGQYWLDIASLAARDHACREGNQFRLRAAATRRELGREFLVNRDIVECSKIVLQI